MFFINLYTRVRNLEKRNADLQFKLGLYDLKFKNLEVEIENLNFIIQNPAKYKTGDEIGGYTIVSSKLIFPDSKTILSSKWALGKFILMLGSIGLSRFKSIETAKTLMEHGPPKPYWEYNLQKDNLLGIVKKESELDFLKN